MLLSPARRWNCSPPANVTKHGLWCRSSNCSELSPWRGRRQLRTERLHSDNYQEHASGTWAAPRKVSVEGTKGGHCEMSVTAPAYTLAPDPLPTSPHPSITLPSPRSCARRRRLYL